MTIGTSLRTAARNLIDAFGNTITIYSYSSATKSYDAEGKETVTWGTGTSADAVFGELIPQVISLAPQFEETLGSADMIIRDDTTIGIKDKVSFNSITPPIK